MSKFWEFLDQRYLKICFYAGTTFVLSSVAISILRSLSPGFAQVWKLICAVLVPIIYGAIIAYLFRPLVNFFERHIKLRRKEDEDDQKIHYWAVLYSVVFAALVLLLIIVAVLLVLTRSLSSVNFDTLRSVLNSAQGDIVKLISTLQETLQNLGIEFGGESSQIGSFVSDASGVIMTLFFSTIFATYFLFDGERLGKYFKRLMNVWFHNHKSIDASRVLSDADRCYSSYFRGQFLDCAAMGLMVAVALTLCGVPYGYAIGVFVAVANLIPGMGVPIGYAAIILVCLTFQDLPHFIAGVIVMTVVVVIEGNFINPRLMANSVQIHPMLTLVAMIAGGTIGGIAGMLVAVPTAAFIMTEVNYWLENKEAEIAAENATNTSRVQEKQTLEEALNSGVRRVAEVIEDVVDADEGSN